MILSLLILALFIVAALLMFFRKLPALLALPLMAVGIGGVEILAGRLTLADISLVVIADGAVRLYEPMVISMFGGILSVLLQKSGVAESIVRRGAELAGDNPWLVSVLMMGIIALLFTTIGGLGAVIMVGTIVLPILASIGVRELVSSGILLFGISIGGLLNANNWALYKSVMHLSDDVVSSYALSVFVVALVGALVFVTIELLRSGNVRLRTLRSSLTGMGIAILVGIGVALVWEGQTKTLAEGLIRWLTGLLILAGVIQAIRDLVKLRTEQIAPHIRWNSYVTTIVPLLLIIVFGVSFISAFLCGIVYGCITTLRRGSLNMISRSVIEGSSSVIPALVLMIGIGMLISAILGPTRTGPGKSWYERQTVAVNQVSNASAGSVEPEWPVTADMKPLIESIVPTSKLSYVLIFALLGPLALYRGPLNIWGLGYGVGGVLLATGVPPGAVMGILMSLGIIQGVSDPTNTQNVWIANELRVGVNEILWRTLPYAWAVAFLGLIAASLRFY
jgi:hypothetical protein